MTTGTIPAESPEKLIDDRLDSRVPAIIAKWQSFLLLIVGSSLFSTLPGSAIAGWPGAIVCGIIGGVVAWIAFPDARIR
jgi:hypothetical protein